MRRSILGVVIGTRDGRMVRTLRAIASVAILCAVPVSSAQAKELFYTTAENGAKPLAIEVHNVDEITTTLIGETGGGNCVTLALSPAGTLYSMCGDLFGIQRLATIDPETGHATLFGVNVKGLAVMALGFDPDRILYAAGDPDPHSPTYNSLYTVDVRTGAFTRIGSTGARLFFMDFAFDRDGKAVRRDDCAVS